jgi:hypothetical protein
MASSKSFIGKLQKIYGIVIGKDATSEDQLRPAETTDDGKLTPIKFSSDLMKLWNYWTKSVTDNPESLKNRLDRYRDLDYMYYNEPIISQAVEMYADETIQFDSQSQPLIVNAKEKKVANYINDLFEKIGINRQSLREIARSLALYGDGYNILALKEGVGYTYSQVVDVTTVKDRIEFNAITVKKEMIRYYGLQNWINKEQRLRALADVLKDMKTEYDPSKYYKSYLFGYKVEDDLFLPPWSVMHFRIFSSKSEFAPYGRPILINSISPFRQLKASKNLMAMARASKFPKEHFEVDVDEEMTEAEKWDAINRAKQQFQNLSKYEGSKEDFAIGGAIWTPKDLLTYKLLNNNISLDDIADIELLRDDEIISTGIPKGYLTNDKGSLFGQSGQALLQQYKPFGRKILTVQTAILEQLVQLIKQQFIISEDYDPEKTEFELSMNYPVIEDSKDRLGMKTDTLLLAKNIIDNLKDVLGINSKLPTDVVKDILTKYTFLGSEDIDTWVGKIEDANEKLSEDDRSKLNNKLNRLNENLVNEAYFNSKTKLNMKEGIINGYHYMTSGNKYTMNERVLETMRLKPMKKEIKG